MLVVDGVDLLQMRPHDFNLPFDLSREFCLRLQYELLELSRGMSRSLLK